MSYKVIVSGMTYSGSGREANLGNKGIQTTDAKISNYIVRDLMNNS